jgi:hypothetical protein
MHPPSRLVLPGLAALALLTAPTALATPNFPGAVRSELELSRTPDCSLCHIGVQARGTVNTPFGTSMRQRGLRARDEGSLRAALASLRDEAMDSDGDGTPDVEELIAGGDPNQGPAPIVDMPPDPTFGCAASPAEPACWSLFLLVFARRLKRVTTWRCPGRTCEGC